MVKQKKRTHITQSRKNCAMNCAIQGVRLIWKQKNWLAICEFLWSLTNQNAWFVSFFFFCTELTLFCTVQKKKPALLLTNQNGEIFSCILLDQKQVQVRQNWGLLFVNLLIRSGSSDKWWARYVYPGGNILIPIYFGDYPQNMNLG